MLLSDVEIRRYVDADVLGIMPYRDELVQPSSVDVRLGRDFQVLDPLDLPGALDPLKDNRDRFRPVRVQGGNHFYLAPGEFALGSTVERITLPDHLAARLEGKSSLGRLGLLLHATAGFIDPGFHGTITLELANLTSAPILLWPGMRVGQLCFMRMSAPARMPYGARGLGSHYHEQDGPTTAAPQERPQWV